MNIEKIVTLEGIDEIVEECKHGLLELRKGVRVFGDFKVDFTPSSGFNRYPDFIFHRKMCTIEYRSDGSGHKYFILRQGENRTVLSNFAGIKITKYIKESPDYPHFEFEWLGEEFKNFPKGTLRRARVDFSGSLFVSYSYNSSTRNYSIYTPKENILNPKLPKNLDEVSEILGIPFDKKIDFDSKVMEMVKIAGLHELKEAIIKA